MSGYHPEKSDLSQHRIKSKIRKYLRYKNRSKRFINKFNNGYGYCHGLAVLAAYGQYLSTQPKTDVPCDNWDWFLGVVKNLSAWDGQVNTLTPEQEIDIDRLISQIHFFQNVFKYLPYGQGSLDRYLVDTSDRTLYQEYTFAALLRASDFTKPIKPGLDNQTTTLLDELLKYNHRLILVSCGRHTLSLFRNNEQVTLYDSNHTSGLQVFDKKEPEALINALFQAYKYDTNKPSPIGFRLFTFEQPAPYINARQLLDQLQTPLVFDYPGNKKKYTALHIAARVGSTDCVAHYLAQGANLAAEDINGQTPRRTAKSRRYTHIADMLLPHQQPVNDAFFGNQNVLFFSNVTPEKSAIVENKDSKMDHRSS